MNNFSMLGLEEIVDVTSLSLDPLPTYLSSKKDKCFKCLESLNSLNQVKMHLCSVMEDSDIQNNHVKGLVLGQSKLVRHNYCAKCKIKHLPNSTKRIHNCQVCEISFATKNEFNSHNRTVHAHEYKVTCTLCGRNFVSKGFLARHLRQFHHQYDLEERGENATKTMENLGTNDTVNKFSKKFLEKYSRQDITQNNHENQCKNELGSSCIIKEEESSMSTDNVDMIDNATNNENSNEDTTNNDLSNGEMYTCTLCAINYDKFKLLKDHAHTVHGVTICLTQSFKNSIGVFYKAHYSSYYTGYFKQYLINVVDEDDDDNDKLPVEGEGTTIQTNLDAQFDKITN